MKQILFGLAAITTLALSSCTSPATAAAAASPPNAMGQSPFAQTVAALRNRGVTP